MTDQEQYQYIKAYSMILNIAEETVKEYVSKRGILALIKNPEPLLETKEQREKHEAFLQLYHMSKVLTSEENILNSPEYAAAFAHSVMKNMFTRESFIAIYLDVKMNVIDYEQISLGGSNSSIVEPSQVFRNAILNKAAGIVVCHNHPSGNTKPSREDIAVTERLQQTGELLGIEVYDHIIVDGINPAKAYSFRENHLVLEEATVYKADKKEFEGVSREENSRNRYRSGRDHKSLPFLFFGNGDDNVSEKQRLFVDMDGTLAVFQPVEQLETLYEKGYFEKLQPMDTVLAAVKNIIHECPEIEVHILSAYLSDSPYALQEKNKWLDRYLPELPRESRVFLPCGADKKDYIPGGIRSSDVLVDDYTQNLQLWQPPARGIKLLNGINHTKGTWQHDRIRYDKPGSEIAQNIVEVIHNMESVYDHIPEKGCKEDIEATTTERPDKERLSLAELHERATQERAADTAKLSVKGISKNQPERQ